MIFISARKCLLCGDAVYSRANYDYRSCYCGNVSVDGGSMLKDEFGKISGEVYGRIIVHDMSKSELTEIALDINTPNLKDALKIMYDDWNKNTNNYGLVRDKSYTDDERAVLKAKDILIR